MMGKLVFALLACAWALALAEPIDERASIEAQRQEISQRLDAQELACQQKFAVTDCVNQVRKQRRELLSSLKKQETRLNDADRRARAQEQRRVTDEKSATHSANGDASGPAPELSTLQQRQKLQDEKRQDHASWARQPVSAVLEPLKSTGPDASTREKNRTDYAKRLEAARQRKLDRDKRVLEKGKAVESLPVPP